MSNCLWQQAAASSNLPSSFSVLPRLPLALASPALSPMILHTTNKSSSSSSSVISRPLACWLIFKHHYTLVRVPSVKTQTAAYFYYNFHLSWWIFYTFCTTGSRNEHSINQSIIFNFKTNQRKNINTTQASQKIQGSSSLYNKHIAKWIKYPNLQGSVTPNTYRANLTSCLW